MGEWRSVRRYLLDVDVRALWDQSSLDEQREVLKALFSGIKATRDCLIFHVQGLEFPVEIAWQSRMSAESMVAGARTEASAPLSPFPTSFSLVVVWRLVREKRDVAGPGLMWSADIPFCLVTA